MNITVQRFEEIGSTNDEAARQARLGAAEGLCIVARRQTAGRGRHGRTWVSEKDSGLYFSIVLRPGIETRFLPLITLAAGIAVYDTLKEFGISPDIKWVNDVLVDEKKISGILAETVETRDGLSVVLGIGINLTSKNFPPELADIATSIGAELKRTDITAIAGEEGLVKYLSYWYEILRSSDGPAEIIENWRSRSSYFVGRRVRVSVSGTMIEGTTDGLEPNGALRLITAEGSRAVIQAGDVQRLRREE
jgi:BirA family transcriptional regulator, biotin operon repressor / biotin---[acetyl-CoA-carboxylase] ligase